MANDNPQSATMDELPNEMLLTIFRKLHISYFIMILPMVCNRWALLVASDLYTLKPTVIHHLHTDIEGVYFFSLKEGDFIDWPSKKFDKYFTNSVDNQNQLVVNYSVNVYKWSKYTEIYSNIKTLFISIRLSIYPPKGTYLKNVTTLVIYKLFLSDMNKEDLVKIGSLYANVNEVLFISCCLSIIFDMKYLHIGFKNLERIRVDHSNVSHEFLDELLKTHRSLKSIKFGDCILKGDRCIEVLLNRLKGQRLIASLEMHSPHFTEKCLKAFLATDNLFIDKKLVRIGTKAPRDPFTISIV